MSSFKMTLGPEVMSDTEKCSVGSKNTSSIIDISMQTISSKVFPSKIRVSSTGS